MGIRRQQDAGTSSCLQELAATLAQADRLLAACLAGASPLVARMTALRGRLAGERLQIAVLGQFKRGKSTFLNALLGVPLLPTGVVPLTAVPTFIAWGPAPLVRVAFQGERPPEAFALREPAAIRDCLFRFVAEEANPENRLQVARVELLYPAPILADGTVLIDTPGVGSTLTHNTEAARQVLPECDAALFVLSADPPITETELAYLEAVKAKVTRLFYVLNKIDYLDANEQLSAVDFLRKVLAGRSLIDAAAPIFCVSARQGLAAKERTNDGDLDASGIAAVEDHLVRYLATEKTRSLEEAIRAKARGILAEAVAEVELRAKALTLPLDELETKRAAFERALGAIEAQCHVTADLLAGDQRRLRAKLEATIDVLRTEISAKVAAAIDASLAGPDAATWQASAQAAIAAAMQEVFDAARGDLSAAFAADTISALSAHQHRIDALIGQVRRAAAEAFDVSFARSIEREPFRLGEDPYWVTERLGTALIPDVGRLVDPLLPLPMRRTRMRTRLMHEADQLVVRNAENLRWAIRRGLDDAFRSAAARLEQRLEQAIAATRGVIADAVARRRDRSFATQSEIDRLASARLSLLEMVERLASSGAAPRDARALFPSAGGRR